MKKKIKISNNMFMLVLMVFSSVWAIYLIMDEMSYQDIPRLMTDVDYRMYIISPTDGATSFLEEIVFGMICPFISVFMCIDYVRRIEKNESRN